MYVKKNSEKVLVAIGRPAEPGGDSMALAAVMAVQMDDCDETEPRPNSTPGVCSSKQVSTG